ncbi:YtxH domain-containing protein [Cohnella hashimotonis]|uniref:YtxH domain-containing protein n=1 Tax=Cohnella hashimotonis TaxID=2826895 RepID=A0ABT6TIW2_9BACL|nr:YtxH domain-containing protein [Cohnella hashimotonis]MDI4646777.1 YtxH domain-containing protein [Cohnella hashimotonis]
MAERKVVKSFLFGALSGAALGAAAALLFAPKSGKELRKDIADTAQVVGTKTADLGKAAGSAAQTVAKKSADWAGGVRAKFGKKAGDNETASADDEAI